VNPSTAQARVVVDELIRGGVRDVVLCPGSRNAPLAFALADADRAGRIRLHVRIDERTAGYLAIGLAVAAGAPVCVAMTSGTAVANLGPAVVEANYARVPLIVLSANRPYELLGTGANQTMEQLGYFGTQVRATISLGLAEGAVERIDALNAQWRSATCRVLVAAKGSRSANAGPVQFDIPLREPLVPDADDTGDTPAGRPDGKPPEGIEAQTRATMDDIGNTLKLAGLGYDDLFHCTVFLSDMKNWAAFNTVYLTYFPDGPLPARSAVGVNGLALGALMEIECQAYAGNK